MSSETYLKPAYSESKLNAEQLSSEDFHRKLYEFFEDRGLLSDLRSHLRTKMINVLKETPIGRSDWKKSMSPKMQAINLLLADFLIQQNCFYSLSVFSTEVPLANILPELNNNFIRKPNSGWKFERKEAFDILETLGFEKDGKILESYYDVDNRESLLCCILKTFPRYLKSVTFMEKEDIVFKDIAEILKGSSLPLLTVEIILQKFSQIKDDIIREQKEKYEKIIEDIKKEKEMALSQTKSGDKRIEGMEQLWENKNKALELKEKQLEEKERELQKREEKLNEMKKEYAKNESECEMLKRKIEELREENIRLENSNGEQRRKADKLKLNARLLSSELSAARTHRRGRVASTLSANGVSVSGEGEQVPLLPQPHQFMGRQKPVFYSSSDETQHFDVLEETRERLQRLQQENDRIERRINCSFNQQKKFLQPSSSDIETTSSCSKSESEDSENKKKLED